MVAAVWDQPSGLEKHSPEIAKPAGEAGRAYRRGPGNQRLVNLFSLTFPSFASDFLPQADLCRFSANSAGCCAT